MRAILRGLRARLRSAGGLNELNVTKFSGSAGSAEFSERAKREVEVDVGVEKTTKDDAQRSQLGYPSLKATDRWVESESAWLSVVFRDGTRGRVALLFSAFLGVQSGWAAAPSPTPVTPAVPKPSASAKVEYSNPKCDAACSEFSGVVTEGTATESQIKQFVLQKCGNEPTAAEIENDKKRVEAGQPSKVDMYKECDSATRHRFNTIGPHCIAKVANAKAQEVYGQQVLTYGGAALACTLACYSPKARATGICGLAGLATVGSELTGMGQMILSGNLASQFKDATAAASFGTAGTVALGAGVGIMMGSDMIKNAGDKAAAEVTSKAADAAKEAGQNAADNFVTKAGNDAIANGATDGGKEAMMKASKDPAKDLAQKSAEESAKNASKDATEAASKKAAEDKAKELESCASAIIMGATFVLKGTGYLVAQSGEEAACKSVEDLRSANYNGTFVTAEGQKGFEASGGLNAEIKATAGSKNTSAAGGEKPKASGDFMGAIAQTMKHEANAGPNTPGGLLKKLNPQSLPDKMKALGMNPNAIAAQLESGKSVSDILGGMSGMSGMAAVMRDTENAVRSGRAGWGGMAGTSYAGGAKAAAPATAAKPAPFSFGAFGGAPAAPKGGELNFAAKKEKTLLPNDGDVFHEKFKGSIFDIISVKLDQNRTKVESLDWQTPLNRAIVGLPPLSRGPAATSPAASQMKK